MSIIFCLLGHFFQKGCFLINSPEKSPHIHFSKENKMNEWMNERMSYLFLLYSGQPHPVTTSWLWLKTMYFFFTNIRHTNYELNGNLIKTSHGDPYESCQSEWKSQVPLQELHKETLLTNMILKVYLTLFVECSYL